MWRAESLKIQPKGLVVGNSGGLAGIARARREHGGQFFTPDELAAFLWKLLQPSFATANPREGKLSIVDTSVGSGRLLQHANPARFSIYGVDTDERCVKALVADAAAAKFEFEFEVADMAEIRPGGFAAALINPPFSLTLESPSLQPFEINTHGRFGALTKAISHRFAVAQALEAAAIVAAVVPRTFADEVRAETFFRERLAAIIHTPSRTFSEEGTEVATSILLFGPEPAPFQEINLSSFQDPVDTPVFDLSERSWRRASLGTRLDCAKPAITIPVTGDTRVRVVRGGRWIHLEFACGLTQARVINAIYGAVIREVSLEDKHRHPAEFKYTGEGQLLLHAHLAQDDPVQSFEGLLHRIRLAGGDPKACPSLIGYLRRQARKIKRHRHPFGHVIRGGLAAPKQIVANTSFPLNPKIWGSPIIKAGQTYQITRDEKGDWHFQSGGKELGSIPTAVFEKRFPELTAGRGEWTVKSPPRTALFPDLARQWERKAAELGIPEWLTWEYQMADLIELCLCTQGAIVAWSMGTGKSRLTIALCLLRGGKHNLITVEPHLVDEMEAELNSLPIDPTEWQIIRSPGAIEHLRKINVISYRRLSMPVNSSTPKKSYAAALRRRIRLVVADEGHLLRHTMSDQSRALWQLSAGIRFVTTGTPLANTPRDLLGVASFVFGDGTAYQPYGMRGAYITQQLANTALYSERGMDRFREDFVTLEWVTNEFAEQMQEGAKREVPAIANLPKYRALVAPLIKRRVTAEPLVAAHVRIPVPTQTVSTVDWDEGHLAFYLQVAEEFYSWYSDRRRSGVKNNNLIAILARIGAIIDATNQPHLGVRGFSAYTPLTSKQRAVLSRIEEVINGGEKVLVFCHSPKAVQRFAAELRKRDIANVQLHGEIPQNQRTEDLRAEFRFGDTPALLATYGVAKTGLNIPEASYVIMYDRDWSCTVERQAQARVLRPQQKRPVRVEFFHLPGSVDEYQAQMVEFKAEAADSGLDWATPTRDPSDFLHLDTILGRFVDDLGAKLGVSRNDVRKALAA